jgi:hypothetical protein
MLFSQQVNLLQETSKMREAYVKHPFLSYQIKYTISAASQPQQVIDTMAGEMQINGHNYRGTLNAIEFMQNKEYLVSAYNDYKMIKVDTPSALYPALANIAFMDSLFGKENYTLSSGTAGNDKTLDFVFKENKFAYKTFSMRYDAQTYFLKQLSYTTAADEEEDNDSELPKGDRLIKIDFTHYNTSAFDTAVFNTQNYFTRQETVLTPQGKFADYQLTIGSSNVIK